MPSTQAPQPPHHTSPPRPQGRARASARSCPSAASRPRASAPKRALFGAPRPLRGTPTHGRRGSATQQRWWRGPTTRACARPPPRRATSRPPTHTPTPSAVEAPAPQTWSAGTRASHTWVRRPGSQTRRRRRASGVAGSGWQTACNATARGSDVPSLGRANAHNQESRATPQHVAQRAVQHWAKLCSKPPQHPLPSSPAGRSPHSPPPPPLRRLTAANGSNPGAGEAATHGVRWKNGEPVGSGWDAATQKPQRTRPPLHPSPKVQTTRDRGPVATRQRVQWGGCCPESAAVDARGMAGGAVGAAPYPVAAATATRVQGAPATDRQTAPETRVRTHASPQARWLANTCTRGSLVGDGGWRQRQRIPPTLACVQRSQRVSGSPPTPPPMAGATSMSPVQGQTGAGGTPPRGTNH